MYAAFLDVDPRPCALTNIVRLEIGMADRCRSRRTDYRRRSRPAHVSNVLDVMVFTARSESINPISPAQQPVSLHMLGHYNATMLHLLLDAACRPHTFHD